MSNKFFVLNPILVIKKRSFAKDRRPFWTEIEIYDIRIRGKKAFCKKTNSKQFFCLISH